MEKRMESSALTDDRRRRRRAAGCLPWRKYAVIYKSVLLESLQYAANMVMGFFAYFIFIFIFVKLWGYIYQTPGALIAGYTKEQMIWYVMMTEMMWFGSNASAVGRQVKTDIRAEILLI